MTDPDDADGEIEIEIEIESDETPPRRWTEAADHRRDGPRQGVDRPESAAERLEDELGRIHLRTTPEGYVEGRITEIESLDATTVRLTVALPHDERVTFDLEKPIPWSREFLLARIAEDVGYEAASIGHLVGESVYLVRTDVGEEAEQSRDWWSFSVRTAGNAMLSSLSDHLRLEDERGPEWRLVDPLERPALAPARSSDDLLSSAATGLVLLAPVAAVLAAVVGLTGGVVLSSAVVGAMLAGLALALFGLALRSTLETK